MAGEKDMSEAQKTLLLTQVLGRWMSESRMVLIIIKDVFF